MTWLSMSTATWALYTYSVPSLFFVKTRASGSANEICFLFSISFPGFSSSSRASSSALAARIFASFSSRNAISSRARTIASLRESLSENAAGKVAVSSGSHASRASSSSAFLTHSVISPLSVSYSSFIRP